MPKEQEKYLPDKPAKHKMVGKTKSSVESDRGERKEAKQKAETIKKFENSKRGMFRSLPLSPPEDAAFLTKEGRYNDWFNVRGEFLHKANDYYLGGSRRDKWVRAVYNIPEGQSYTKADLKPGTIDKEFERTVQTVKVVSVDDVQVVKVWSEDEAGNHGNAIYTYCAKDHTIYYYAHLRDRLPFKRGDFIQTREIIGWMGRTGNASTNKFPHLHFQIAGARYKKGMPKTFENLLLSSKGEPKIFYDDPGAIRYADQIEAVKFSGGQKDYQTNADLVATETAPDVPPPETDPLDLKGAVAPAGYTIEASAEPVTEPQDLPEPQPVDPVEQKPAPSPTANSEQVALIQGSDDNDYEWLVLDKGVVQALTYTSLEDLALLTPYIKIGILRYSKEKGTSIDWITHKFFSFQCDTREDYMKDGGKPKYSLQSFNVSTKEVAAQQRVYEGRLAIKVHWRNTVKALAEQKEENLLSTALTQYSDFVIQLGYRYNGNNPQIAELTKRQLSLLMSPSTYESSIDEAGQLTLSLQMVGAIDRYMEMSYLGEEEASIFKGILYARKKIRELEEEEQKINSKGIDSLTKEQEKQKTEIQNQINKHTLETVETIAKIVQTRINKLKVFTIDNIEYIQLGDIFLHVIEPTLVEVFNSISPEGNGNHTVHWGKFNQEAGKYSGQPIYSFKIRKADLLNKIKEWSTNPVEPGIKLTRFLLDVLNFTQDESAYYVITSKGNAPSAEPQESKEKRKGKRKEHSAYNEAKETAKTTIKTPDVIAFIDSQWDLNLEAFIFHYYILDRRESISSLNKLIDEIGETKKDKKKFLDDHQLPYLELLHMNSLIKNATINVESNDMMKTVFLTRGLSNINERLLEENKMLDTTDSPYKDQVFLPLRLTLSLFGFPTIVPGLMFYFFSGYDIAQWDGMYNIITISHTINEGSITTQLEAVKENS